MTPELLRILAIYASFAQTRKNDIRTALQTAVATADTVMLDDELDEGSRGEWQGRRTAWEQALNDIEAL